METAARIGILLLVMAAGAVGCAPAMRAWAEERRLALLATLAVLVLVLLVLAGPALSAYLRMERGLPAPAAVAGIAAAGATAIALGVIWSSIFADSSRRSSRLAVLSAAFFAFFFCMISSPYWAMLALPLGARTGWARPIGRRFPPIAFSVLGFLALLAWPSLPLRSFCWPPGCDLGLPLLRFARVFLAAQLGLIAIKITFGLMFGPRRIGRRLLVSHLVAGIVPVALTGLFALLMALLAIAHVRASLATDLIRAQHLVSDQVLGRCAEQALDETAETRAQFSLETAGPGELALLAIDIARRWPRETSWRPEDEATGDAPDPSPDATPSPGAAYLTCSRLYLCLSVARGDGTAERSLLIHCDRREGEADGGPVQWVHEDLSTGERTASQTPGRSAASQALGAQALAPARDAGHFAHIPSPAAWASRPSLDEGSGLVKALGNTFHVADQVVAWGDGRLRVQLIEQLPYGRARLFEKWMDAAVRIEETLRFTPRRQTSEPSGEPGSLRTAAWMRGSRAAEALESLTGGYDVSVDSLADRRPPVRRASSRSSSYVLSPVAQEWLGPQVAVGGEPGAIAANMPNGSAAAGGWREIRLSVVGMSALRDLVPAVPHLSENLLGVLPFIILISTALLFVLVQTVMLVLVARTGRTIAQSVGDLRVGTEHLRRGDLHYRIPIHGVDELATLGEAFNGMAEGLEEAQRIALENERLESELELARQIQLQLLPAEPPVLRGFQVAGFSSPARQVGGDYFDFLRLAGDQLFFVLADVSGKGAAAAILMSGVRAALHSMPLERDELPAIASRLNEFVHRSTRISEFVTLFMGILDRATGEVRYVNAGQDPPYLIHADGSFERLIGGGLVLGAFPHAGYEQASLSLEPGDLFVLYTDGLTEAFDAAGGMFGTERLEGVLPRLTDCTSQEAIGRILDALRRFTGETEAADDITLVAIRKAPRAET